MLNTWLRIILCRRLRVGNPCVKDQLEDLKHVGKINIRNWKKVVQDRDSWKKVVGQATTLYRL